jgi:hypothetical protein
MTLHQKDSMFLNKMTYIRAPFRTAEVRCSGGKHNNH